MFAVFSVVTDATMAVHGIIELFQDRKLITGVFFTDFKLMGLAEIGFGKGRAMIAAGGDSDRHGFQILVLLNLRQKMDKGLILKKYGIGINKNGYPPLAPNPKFLGVKGRTSVDRSLVNLDCKRDFNPWI